MKGRVPRSTRSPSRGALREDASETDGTGCRRDNCGPLVEGGEAGFWRYKWATTAEPQERSRISVQYFVLVG